MARGSREHLNVAVGDPIAAVFAQFEHWCYLCRVMSYTNLVYHIVFRTYRSIPAIEEAHEREFYVYAYGYTTRHRAKLYRIGGMPDHVHILVSLPPDLAVSEFVRGLKYATNGWMKPIPCFRFSQVGEKAMPLLPIPRSKFLWLSSISSTRKNITGKHPLLRNTGKSFLTVVAKLMTSTS